MEFSTSHLFLFLSRFVKAAALEQIDGRFALDPAQFGYFLDQITYWSAKSLDIVAFYIIILLII